MDKTITIRPLHDPVAAKRDLEFWLSKTPAERVDAVEILREFYYGPNIRLERVARVVKRSRS